ncbi:hypothetical protein F5B18DRAFT_573009 [Nemania serpens]|nr:hypothetical protein F5B18DRAFT_573009 [Nemania serpens]
MLLHCHTAVSLAFGSDGALAPYQWCHQRSYGSPLASHLLVSYEFRPHILPTWNHKPRPLSCDIDYLLLLLNQTGDVRQSEVRSRKDKPYVDRLPPRYDYLHSRRTSRTQAYTHSHGIQHMKRRRCYVLAGNRRRRLLCGSAYSNMNARRGQIALCSSMNARASQGLLDAGIVQRARGDLSTSYYSNETRRGAGHVLRQRDADDADFENDKHGKRLARRKSRQQKVD